MSFVHLNVPWSTNAIPVFAMEVDLERNLGIVIMSSETWESERNTFKILENNQQEKKRLLIGNMLEFELLDNFLRHIPHAEQVY